MNIQGGMWIQLRFMIHDAGKFNQLVYQYPIRIPERFSLVIRSLLTQEGICFTLKPDFKFLEVSSYYSCFSIMIIHLLFKKKKEKRKMVIAYRLCSAYVDGAETLEIHN